MNEGPTTTTTIPFTQLRWEEGQKGVSLPHDDTINVEPMMTPQDFNVNIFVDVQSILQDFVLVFSSLLHHATVDHQYGGHKK